MTGTFGVLILFHIMYPLKYPNVSDRERTDSDNLRKAILE